MSKTTKLDIRLREDQKEFIQARADEQGCSKGAVVGYWIDAYMREWKKNWGDDQPSVGPTTNKEEGHG